MPSAIEDRVYALISDQTGTSPGKLRPDSTLSHDLGIEGDDAVEFFQKFASEFQVDLAPLETNWHCYFAPEGVAAGTFLMAGAPPLASAFFLNLEFPKFPLWLAMVVAFAVWWPILYLWTRMRGTRSPQISIQDLVDCVKAGRWTKMLLAQPPQRRNRAAKEFR